MTHGLRRTDSDKVIGMVLACKRRRHLNPKFLKLLTVREVEHGVTDCTTEDLFWSVTRELGLSAPKTGASRKRAA